MKIKASAGLLSGGLLALIGGPVIATIHTTDQGGYSTYPVFYLGLLIGVLGLVLLAIGIYRFARNVDLAVATYVKGPDAARRLYQPRDVRLREDSDA